jgi:hypothetical protein
MPITLSYDLKEPTPAHRNYLRSMLERFAWKRLGGSVFRYEGRRIKGHLEEDWLNDVAPSLMFFRSYTVQHGIGIKFFTLDTNSVSRIDHSDSHALLGRRPFAGSKLKLRPPTNKQSSERAIRDFVDSAIQAT